MAATTQFSMERELAKHRDISLADVRQLRAWLATQPHLPGDHISDLDLVLAYHCCERSMEVTKQVLDLHYTTRTLFTSFFKDRAVDSRIELNLHTYLYAPLPLPSRLGYRVIYIRLLDADPRVFSFTDIGRSFMMMVDLYQYQEGTWPGVVAVIDMDQTSLAHITKLEINVVRQALYFIQECILVKLIEIHFMNAPSFMDKLMMIIKPFMKKSLLEIIHIHQVGSSTIYESVPKAAFPKEEGGEYKDHNTIRDELVQKFRANRAFFRDENRRRVNEKLRPGGTRSSLADQLGTQGSFKKLDID